MADTIPVELRRDAQNLTESRANAGFVHAPSIQQAVTAALLRNGYLSHADPIKRDLLTVNLSSARVRQALFYLEGIRQGQELSALLGYQFERGLHDANLDTFVYRFREKFPLKVKEKDLQAGQSIEVVAARNVVDGYALVTTAKTTPYPYGVVPTPPLSIPAIGTADAAKIIKIVDGLKDALDAVSDVALSESVYQFTQGNHEKAAGTLQMVQEGKFPDLPDVVQTPRNGSSLTNRMMLQLPTVAPLGGSPRSDAEPAVNAWLSGILTPILSKTKVILTILRPDNSQMTEEMDFSVLGLTPLDSVFLVGNKLKDLEKRIFYQYRRANSTMTPLAILYDSPTLTPDPTLFSFGEALPLLEQLQNTVQNSRPMTALDFRMPTKGKPSNKDNVGNVVVSDLQTRVNTVLNNFESQILDPLSISVQNFKDNLSKPNLPNDTLDLVKGELGNAAQMVIWLKSFEDATLHDIAEAQISAPVALTAGKIQADFDHVSFVKDGAPLDPKQTVLAIQKMFSDKFSGSPNDLPTFQFLTQLIAVKNNAAQKHKEATAFLAQLPTAKDNDAINLLTKAAKALLGASAVIVPRFNVENATELTTAFGQREQILTFKKSTLPAELSASAEAVRFTVMEEWLQSISRVRERMGAVEGLKMTAETLTDGTTATDLTPLQLPALGKKWWIGLDLPPTETIPNPYFDPANPLSMVTVPTEVGRDYVSMVVMNLAPTTDFTTEQVGLMLDEWTEVIPSRHQNTGVAVHYNQPNSEPPQSLLLALSPNLTGKWTWEKLIGTLEDTLRRAKLRAIHPDIITENSLYSQVLPGITTVTGNPNRYISFDIRDNYSKYVSK